MCYHVNSSDGYIRTDAPRIHASQLHSRQPFTIRGAHMTARTFRWLPALTLIAATLAAQPAAAQKKIYIVTDLEGISGVYKFSQTRESDTPLAVQAREYFMGDLAAVVRGLRAGRNRDIGLRRPRQSGNHPASDGSRGQVCHRPAKTVPRRPGRNVRGHGRAGVSCDDGHARRRPQSHHVVEDRKSLLVQRRRIGRIGDYRRHRRPLRRAAHLGHR